MKQSCSICSHASRRAIDAAICGKKPYRQIAREFAVTLSTISRHRNHLGRPSEGAEPTNALLEAVDYAIEATRGCIARGRRKAGIAGATLILRASHELGVLVELRQKLETRRPITAMEPAREIEITYREGGSNGQDRPAAAD